MRVWSMLMAGRKGWGRVGGWGYNVVVDGCVELVIQLHAWWRVGLTAALSSACSVEASSSLGDPPPSALISHLHMKQLGGARAL